MRVYDDLSNAHSPGRRRLPADAAGRRPTPRRLAELRLLRRAGRGRARRPLAGARRRSDHLRPRPAGGRGGRSCSRNGRGPRLRPGQPLSRPARASRRLGLGRPTTVGRPRTTRGWRRSSRSTAAGSPPRSRSRPAPAASAAPTASRERTSRRSVMARSSSGSGDEAVPHRRPRDGARPDRRLPRLRVRSRRRAAARVRPARHRRHRDHRDRRRQRRRPARRARRPAAGRRPLAAPPTAAAGTAAPT